jgi:RNA polymerase sigma-70 factor (ECF subfamily)
MVEGKDEREARVQPAVAQPAGGFEPTGEIERIFREHAPRVLQAAYRVTGNADDAEDVLQTVFLRLVRREGGSPLSDSPGNYLHRAAINAALDVVRSRRSHRAGPLEPVETVLADPSIEADPERLCDSAELKARVRAALAALSPRSAEIFVLRYFEGYDNHEIARMVGSSRSTVGVILHRARHALREAFGVPRTEGEA